jgi:hypothetical protein
LGIKSPPSPPDTPISPSTHFNTASQFWSSKISFSNLLIPSFFPSPPPLAHFVFCGQIPAGLYHGEGCYIDNAEYLLHPRSVRFSRTRSGYTAEGCQLDGVGS